MNRIPALSSFANHMTTTYKRRPPGKVNWREARAAYTYHKRVAGLEEIQLVQELVEDWYRAKASAFDPSTLLLAFVREAGEMAKACITYKLGPNGEASATKSIGLHCVSATMFCILLCSYMKLDFATLWRDCAPRILERKSWEVSKKAMRRSATYASPPPWLEDKPGKPSADPAGENG